MSVVDRRYHCLEQQLLAVRIFTHQRLRFDIFHQKLAVEEWQANVRDELSGVLLALGDVMLDPVYDRSEDSLLA
jgi:hypothetical protein